MVSAALICVQVTPSSVERQTPPLPVTSLRSECAGVDDFVGRPVVAGIELHLIHSANSCLGIGAIAYGRAGIAAIPDKTKGCTAIS